MPFILRLVLVLVLMYVVVGIGNFLINGINRIKTGTIVDKTHTPVHITTSATGKNKPQLTPEMYMLAIQGEKRGNTVTYWKTVSEEEYHRYDIDMQYP